MVGFGAEGAEGGVVGVEGMGGVEIEGPVVGVDVVGGGLPTFNLFLSIISFMTLNSASCLALIILRAPSEVRSGLQSRGILRKDI